MQPFVYSYSFGSMSGQGIKTRSKGLKGWESGHGIDSMLLKRKKMTNLRFLLFLALAMMFSSCALMIFGPSFQRVLNYYGDLDGNSKDSDVQEDREARISYPIRHQLDDCSNLLECLQRCDYLDGRNIFPYLKDAKYLMPLLNESDHERAAIDPETVVSAFDGYTEYLVKQSNKRRSKFVWPTTRTDDYITCRSAPLDTSPKKFKIAVVTVSTLEENDAIQQSISDKMQYAEAWGYSFHKLGRSDEKRNPHWSKIPAILSVLHLYDYVWWVDLDSVIMDHTIPLESIIDPRYDVIFTNDHNGLNSGSFIVRNTDWSRGFFASVWSRIDNSFPWPGEQGAILDALGDTYLRNHCKMIHYHWMNDFHFKTQQNIFRNTDFFLLHFAGNSPDRKWKLLKVYLRKRKLKNIIE